MDEKLLELFRLFRDNLETIRILLPKDDPLCLINTIVLEIFPDNSGGIAYMSRNLYSQSWRRSSFDNFEEGIEIFKNLFEKKHEPSD